MIRKEIINAFGQKEFIICMKKIIKNNAELLIFILVHILIFGLVFAISFMVVEISDDVIFNGKPLLIEFILIEITILISFLFVVKQIYINRITRKYISKIFTKQVIYKIMVLVLLYFLLSLNVAGELGKSLIICSYYTIVFNIIAVFYEMNKIEIETKLDREVEQIIKRISRYKEIDGKYKELRKIYDDCLEKNEVNIIIKIVNAFEKFFEEKLSIQNKYLLETNVKEDDVFEGYKKLLSLLSSMIINEDDANLKRIDKKIYSVLINCLKNSYKCKYDNLVEYIQMLFIFFSKEKSVNFSNDIFYSLMSTLLNDEVKSADDYINKINFIVRLNMSLIEKNKIDSYDFIIYQYLDSLKENEINSVLFDEKTIKKYVNIIFRNLLITKNDFSMMGKIEQLDKIMYDNKKYEYVMKFYNKIPSLLNFLNDERVTLQWIEHFEKLINESRKDFIEKYYVFYFEVIAFSIEKYGALKKDIFNKIDYNIFEMYNQHVTDLLHVSIQFEKYRALSLLLDSINEIALNTNKNEKVKQLKVLELYETAFVIILNNKNKSTDLYFVIGKFKELIGKMDKENIISDDLFKKIINTLNKMVETYSSYKNTESSLIMTLMNDILDEDKMYRHTTTDNILYVCEKYYELAFKAAENNDNEIIEKASNYLGWIVIRFVKKGRLKEAKHVFGYGFNLLKMLIKINYDESTVNFVSTFIVTLGSFCFSTDTDYVKNQLGNKIVNDVNKIDKEYIENAVMLRNPIKKSWNSVLNCDFDKGFDIFCKKIGL